MPSASENYMEDAADTAILDAAETGIQPVMVGLPHWMLNPVMVEPSFGEHLVAIENTGLDGKITKALKTENITHLFPVQTAVMSWLSKSDCGDLCVSAPTGSGKTLSYVLPIVEALRSRTIVRLRALIIVPNRDLASQVHAVFTRMCASTPLKVGLAVGQTSLGKEQKRLTGSANQTRLAGGHSLVDILIATPGRLVDHLHNTANFTLQHLEYLVVDEADRLLDQSFQDWLFQVLHALNPANTIPVSSSCPDALSFRSQQTALLSADCWVTKVKKLLFSATLTRNPAKIADLYLHQPTYLLVSSSAEQRYTKPAGLKESMLVCNEDQKPLFLLYLVISLKLKHVLCFTNSVESTERLYELLKFCNVKGVAAFTGDLKGTARSDIIQSFNDGAVDILVCSDSMARGLDLNNVENVILYDAPSFAKTYMHRIGRTARAGRSGSAYTILARKEAYHFKEMMQKISPDKRISRIRVTPAIVEPYVATYQDALQKLEQLYKHRGKRQTSTTKEESAVAKERKSVEEKSATASTSTKKHKKAHCE